MKRMQRRISSLKSWATMAAIAATAIALSACSTRTPAPIVDRSVRPATPQPEVRVDPPVSVTPINPSLPGNTAGSQFHVVQRGETLYGIARSNGVDINALGTWNNLVAGAPLREGQVLRLSPPLGSAPAPTSSGTTVTAIPSTGAIQGQPLPAGAALPPGVAGSAPSLSPLVTPVEAPLKREPKSQRLPYSEGALAALQRGDAAAGVAPDVRPAAPVSVTPATPSAVAPSSPSPSSPASSSAPVTPAAPAVSAVDVEIKPGTGIERDGITWAWPTSGKVLTKFNDKAPMKGIDIAANAGTSVVAAATGKVIYVGKEPRGYGQMIVVNHAKETVSVYFHTDKVQVKEQQRVLLGQKLAEVADGAGNKMHFEVRRQGRPLDPVSLMPR